jgi:hypothetical protein
MWVYGFNQIKKAEGASLPTLPERGAGTQYRMK